MSLPRPKPGTILVLSRNLLRKVPLSFYALQRVKFLCYADYWSFPFFQSLAPLQYDLHSIVWLTGIHIRLHISIVVWAFGAFW